MKTESFTLATADASWMQDGLWTALYYEEGSAGGVLPTIRVRSLTGSGKVDAVLKPGRQITLREPAQGIVITSACGQPITGKVTMGAGDIRDSSVIGEVSVIDGGRARSLLGVAYSANGYQSNGAGVYPHVQLYNPNPAGGANFVVGQIIATCSLNDTVISLRTYAGALPGSAAAAGASKLVGQPDKASVIRTYGGAAVAGVSQFGQLGLKAATTAFYKFTEPMVIPPGKGVFVVAVGTGGANNDLAATFEFFEEADA